MVEEGSVTLPIEVPETVSKTMSPFYNPDMRLNRETSMAALSTLDGLDAVFPLAGSGVRALRCLNEQDVFDEVVVNDINPHFEDRFQEYAEANGVDLSSVDVRSTDARSLPFDLRSYDFIEIDPFGSPNKYVDSAVQELRDGGLIAVTATDTAPLSGTYPTTCERNYWATPLRNAEMHEFGLRILIRKIQLVGAQHERALTPVLSYADKHYFKTILSCSKSKTGADALLDQHGRIKRDDTHVGPMWTGSLLDEEFLNKVDLSFRKGDRVEPLLERLRGEASIGAFGFVDVHELAGELSLSGPPKIRDVIEGLKKIGCKACRTSFSHTGVKTDASKEQVRCVMRD